MYEYLFFKEELDKVIVIVVEEALGPLLMSFDALLNCILADDEFAFGLGRENLAKELPI